jgi:hypothetical protein
MTFSSRVNAWPVFTYGDGSESNPYRITSCFELQNMLSIGGSTLNGSFKLVTNIDCAGQDFSAGPTHLIGNFDGGGHTIKNLTVGQYGLFYIIENGTVKNLRIIGSQGDYKGGGMGGLAVIADTVIIDNVHVYMDLDDPGNQSGGLVRQATDSTITNSSYHGSIIADDSGGLVGVALNTDVSHAYASGSITGENSGGLVGPNSAAMTISDSVSIMNLGATYSGGLVGPNATSITIVSSIYAGTASPMAGGNIVGPNAANSIVNNAYYLAADEANAQCIADPSDGSNIVNNCYEEPLGLYNDNHVQSIVTINSGYWKQDTLNTPPVLKSIDGFNDSSSIPNDGDANGDGTVDSYQAAVAPIAGRNNQDWVTVELSGDNACYLEDSESSWIDAHTAYIDTNFDRVTNDMTGFSLYCRDQGGTSTITLIYDKLINTSNAVLRQFNESTNTYQTISGASFGTRNVGGNTVTTATYTITDGGPYDLDGSANRIIIDPVGIAKPATNSSTSPLAPTGDNAIAITRVAGVGLFTSVLIAVVYIRKKIIV